MGAMVYQISSNKKQKVENAMSSLEGNMHTKSQKLMSMAMKRRSTMMAMMESADDEAMNSAFMSVMDALQIEHSLVETDFKHEFLDDKVQDVKSSPYMEVKSENDKLKLTNGAYKLPDGKAQDATEKKTLEHCLIPGVNKRLDMPK